MDNRILDNMDQNHRDLVGRVDELTKLMRQHVESPGHTGQGERLKALEDEMHTQKGKPLQTWQIISGIIALLISISFLALSFGSDTLTLIMFIRSLH